METSNVEDKVVSTENINPKVENSKPACSEPDKQPSEATSSTSVQSNQPDAPDVFNYLQRDEFTSEIFKIEINNLPKHCGINQLRKKLVALGLNPGKVKVLLDSKYAYVNFRCEEDRQKALELVEGHTWKGKQMIARKANPAADPLQRKRKQDAEHDERSPKHVKVDDRPLGEQLNDIVSPFWKMPYDDQLKKKQTEIKAFIKRLGRDIQRNIKDVIDMEWYRVQFKKHHGLCCELLDVQRSPVLENYRNKCELTIGQSPSGVDNTVGFRLGQYKGGVVSVVEPDECVIIPDAMKQCATGLQHYLQRLSPYAGFHPETKSGHWKQATVRINQQGHIMMIIVFCPQKLSQEEVDAEKQNLTQYFVDGAGSSIPIKSLYFETQAPRHDDEFTGSCDLLKGVEHLEEDLMGLKFRISPNSFFQVNTLGAEVLYSRVRDWCGITSDTILMDICCGTGTIGLTMANNVQKVIGIELCEAAVNDAKVNAAANNLTNTFYHCGKAEALLSSIINHYYNKEVVAVVDPPRAGLHADVVKAIRRCAGVKRLIYVSCKASGALANLIDFTRTESRRMKGEPFRMIRAVPVDLFPHTPHVELVMMFERGSLLENNTEKLDSKPITDTGKPENDEIGPNDKPTEQIDSKPISDTGKGENYETGPDDKTTERMDSQSTPKSDGEPKNNETGLDTGNKDADSQSTPMSDAGKPDNDETGPEDKNTEIMDSQCTPISDAGKPDIK